GYRQGTSERESVSSPDWASASPDTSEPGTQNGRTRGTRIRPNRDCAENRRSPALFRVVRKVPIRDVPVVIRERRRRNIFLTKSQAARTRGPTEHQWHYRVIIDQDIVHGNEQIN